MLTSYLKPKFNAAETKKTFHEFSFKHSSNFFLYVGYIVFVFATLAVRNEFTGLLLAHAQDIVVIIANLFFLVHDFDRK